MVKSEKHPKGDEIYAVRVLNGNIMHYYTLEAVQAYAAQHEISIEQAKLDLHNTSSSSTPNASQTEDLAI